MSSALKHIGIIECNIFTLTPLLVAFYRHMPHRKRNLLYAYLLFPIVLHKPSQKLTTLNSRSRINRITDDTDIMAGFQDRLQFYKEYTNQCIQYAVECGALVIDTEHLTLTTGKQVKFYTNPKLEIALKVSNLLPKILKQDVVTTYIQLGIHQL